MKSNLGRLDWRGESIKRGSKLHKVTFKDEVDLNQSEEQESRELTENNISYNSQGNRRSNSIRKRRGNLSDVIIVESYKEFNAS